MRILVLIATLAPFAAFAQSPSIAYFKSNWCPAEFEEARLVNITKTYYRKPGTCCIDRAILPNGVTLEYMASKFPLGFSETEDTNKCTGYKPEGQDAIDLLSEKATYAEIGKRIELRRREQEAEEEAKRKEAYAKELADTKESAPSMSPGELCWLYGDAVRSTKNELASIVLSEIRKKKIPHRATAAKDRSIKIGDSVCSMQMALGLPDDANRTVNASGVKIQHVYRKRGLYVYTNNGIVTSWQD